MKPKKHLLAQILVIVVAMQTFNFDRVSPSTCAAAACVCVAVEQVIEVCRIVSGFFFSFFLIYFFLNLATSYRQPHVRAVYSFDAVFGC